MLIAGLARFASPRSRALLSALLAWMAMVLPAAHAAEPNVTEIVVRFRDTPPSDLAAAPSAAQLNALGQALRTGIAGFSATIDGGFRVALAPAMPFSAARTAVNRLRMHDDILYASVGATDAPRGPPSVVAPSDQPDPPLFRLIVRYRDARAVADAAADRPLDSARLDALAALAGQPVVHERTMAWARAHLVRLLYALPREQVEAIAQALARDPDVLWAQPDYLHQPGLTPNDPLYVNQWHYHEAAGGANLPNAWDTTTGFSGIRVAVADTGALFGHPDLGSRFIGGYDMVVAAGSVDPRDGDNRDPNAADEGDWRAANECGPGSGASNSSWHGSHVSGTIGAASNNATGVAGVNWVSRIVPVRVLAKCGGFTSDISDGIVWASGGPVTGVPANAHPARVLNMSLGGRRLNQQCDAATQVAVNTAVANNTVVVVSAGNSNEDASFSSPANCNGVVTVAATGRGGQRATYSNHDVNDLSGIQVEIAAPGGSFADDGVTILSTLNSGTTTPNAAGHNYVQYQGTSMAAPHVAGVVSLMLSLKPSLTPAQVSSLLATTARPFPSGTVRDCTSNLGSVTAVIKYCGAGIVNTDALLDNIMATGGPGGTAMTKATSTLASSLNPASSGTPVTFTSNVTGLLPTGTVAFADGDLTIGGCGAVALTGVGNTRSAQCTTSTLPPGAHTIRAAYSGDAVNTPADAPLLSQVVNPGAPLPTTTTVASSANPVNQGVLVTFTATVTGFIPGGTVLFRANAVTIAGCGAVALTGAGDTRTAQCSTSTLPAGNNAIEAVYSGDPFNLASSGTMTQGIIAPTACSTYNDVLATHALCPNVQWIRNRIITSGCDLVNYCPGNTVGRLQMAAFMNREGTALTPIDLPLAIADLSYDLSSPRFACVTGGYTVTNYPRRAFLRASANVYNPQGGVFTSGDVDVAIEFAYSTDGGVSWTTIPNTRMNQTLYDVLPLLGDDKTIVPFGAMDLAVGTTYHFALRVSRAAGTGNIFMYCVNSVQIGNRNAASPPF